jgi:hypothetical protein
MTPKNTFLTGLLGTGSGIGSALLSIESSLEIRLRLLALVIGILVSTGTLVTLIYSLIRKIRFDSLQEEEMVHRICKECLDGNPPLRCPLTPKEKNKWCPLKRKQKHEKSH